MLLQIKIWDTAGSEKYMSVATAYYRKADGVILVFDVTNEKSFVNVQSRWLDAIMSEDWYVNFFHIQYILYMYMLKF